MHSIVPNYGNEMSKYSPLRDHLASYPEDRHELLMTFEQIEDLVGKLPRSAYVHRAWWANTTDARVEARAWRSAGWHVKSIDQKMREVVFARSITDTSPVIAQKLGQRNRLLTALILRPKAVNQYQGV